MRDAGCISAFRGKAKEKSRNDKEEGSTDKIGMKESQTGALLSNAIIGAFRSHRFNYEVDKHVRHIQKELFI